MKKVAEHNGYAYYIGKDEAGKRFYNIVPDNQSAPNGGYAKEYILGVKKVPDLFPTDEMLKVQDWLKERADLDY